MAAYYNENDPYTAAYLRNLIAAGLIADGEVDERSIETVATGDLHGFHQCHFFAGIGGWSYALRRAGWPDDRSVWTGSCPCQPFSNAGAKAGGNDPRDLWPTWFQLLRVGRPPTVFGEQVEGAITHGWLDRVAHDMESQGYAIGTCALPASSVGAFHRRNRVWFVAESHGGGRARPSIHVREREPRGAMSDPPRPSPQNFKFANFLEKIHRENFWSGNVEWVPCADHKLRPSQSGVCPVVDGVPAGMAIVRAAGNAIVPQVAQAFIEAYMDCQP